MFFFNSSYSLVTEPVTRKSIMTPYISPQSLIPIFLQQWKNYSAPTSPSTSRLCPTHHACSCSSVIAQRCTPAPASLLKVWIDQFRTWTFLNMQACSTAGTPVILVQLYLSLFAPGGKNGIRENIANSLRNTSVVIRNVCHNLYSLPNAHI